MVTRDLCCLVGLRGEAGGGLETLTGTIMGTGLAIVLSFTAVTQDAFCEASMVGPLHLELETVFHMDLI